MNQPAGRSSLGRSFCDRSRHHLEREYLPRLRVAVEKLGPADIWWRPHEGTNSVGNLLLHLEGNVRQWILAGVGGEADHRRRATEFSAREGADVDTLLDALEATVVAAGRVFDGLSDENLARPVEIQGFEVTVMQAIYHVVEHFAWHTGQVTWMAKLRAGPGHGLAFYDDSKL